MLGSFPLPVLVKLFNEKEAGNRENLRGFSCLDRSLIFFRSLLFRPKLNDGRRESVDCRGLSDAIGAFMLVGGYLFSLVGSPGD